MAEPPIAPASLRNSEPILGVLRYALAERRTLLEIGSGTGQHAVYFAPQLPALSWQTSELSDKHGGIHAHLRHAGISNVKPPLSLDVRSAELEGQKYDVVYTCNTAHIMGFAAVTKMISLASSVLTGNGLFCCYGPFRRDGKFNTKSNEKFDTSLRASDPEMGIRDLDEIDALAMRAGMHRRQVYAMPANNLFVIWEKNDSASSLKVG